MSEIGREVDLLVHDLNVDGGAVARLDGRVYFLDRGLPGETVRAVISGQKKRVLFGRVLQTLRPSPEAVQPFCPYFGLCGGCALQNLSYPAQLEFKQRRVTAVLAKIGGLREIADDLPGILPSPLLRACRNKMEYAFGIEQSDSGEELVLGLRYRASHQVLDIEACPLQSPRSGLILQAVRLWAREGGFSGGCLRHLILREPEYLPEDNVPQCSVELICGDKLPPPQAVDELWQRLAALGVTSFLLGVRRSAYNLARSERIVKIFGPTTLWEKFGPLLLELPVTGFAQTNTGAASLLYQRAAELAAPEYFGRERGGARLWDAYCGSGAMALYLAPGSASVIGFEQDPESAEMARANAARLGFDHCSFLAGDAADLLAAGAGTDLPDLLLTDPPRGGMSPKALAAIKKCAPRRIIYISCDPATLARDLTGLTDLYELSGLTLLDMFPHTTHVETIARLDLRNK
ncbi:MAG: 23S rRNA (uracil(1939)-C(5))-methyltransferase RlmD [Deltaproteobacteria bacterium]|jgi:23S rRNA (uracil1939-C5)-methyltransferase|nr:23S rRNA (uracil(1939)-C(5))-methyltransferase RlmD [Deltaproteobacteria bacterium]